MKDKNEPKPGYLGQNLEGHKEPIPEMAWEGIEARLNRKKRRGLFFWIVGVMGLILTGIGLWEFCRSNKEMEISSAQVVNRQQQEIIPKEDSHPEKPIGGIQPKAQIHVSDSVSLGDKVSGKSGNGPSEKDLVSKESPDRSETATGKKDTKDLVFSKADQKGRQAVSVSTNRDALPETFHQQFIESGISGTLPEKKKTRKKSNEPASTSALALEQKQPISIIESKKEIQKDLQPGKSISNSPEPEEFAGQVSSRISTEVFQQKPNVVLNENQEDQTQSQSNSNESQISPSVVNASKDSVLEQVAKTVVLPDSQAISQTDSAQPQKQKKESYWMLSFHAGLMVQNASLQQDYFTNEGLPMVAVSPSDVSKAPSFRLAMSRLWQLSRSLWLGIEVSANGIFQKASAILNPSEETPIRYEYGPDSLSVVAVTGYQNLRQTFNRNTLVTGLYPRIQWKPMHSPIGIQARFRVASFTHVLTGEKPTEAFEYSPQNWEIGLWAPISQRHQISIDCNRMSWTQNSLPVPVKNPGKNWILSVGYGWKW